jgi:hypothetical protein
MASVTWRLGHAPPSESGEIARGLGCVLGLGVVSGEVEKLWRRQRRFARWEHIQSPSAKFIATRWNRTAVQ